MDKNNESTEDSFFKDVYRIHNGSRRERKKKNRSKIDSHHSKVAFPRGAATSVTKWARSLKRITTTFTAIERNVFFAPRNSTSVNIFFRRIKH